MEMVTNMTNPTPTRYTDESTLGDNVSVVIPDDSDPYVFARQDDAMVFFKSLVYAASDVTPLPEIDALRDNDEYIYQGPRGFISITHTTLILDDNREVN